VEWLESLGEVRMNWEELQMKIQVQGLWLKLQGDPSLERTQVFLKSMLKTLRNKEELVLIALDETTNQEQQSAGLFEEVQEVLQGFKEVWELNEGLPPR